MSGYIPEGFTAAQTAYNTTVTEAGDEMSALAGMVALIKNKDGGKMSTDELFAYVTETVMHQMMNAKGASTVGVYGAKLKVQDVCSEVVNKMVGDLNYLLKNYSNTTTPACVAKATNLYNRINWLQSQMTSGPSGGAPVWMDSTTASNITQACSSFQDVVDKTAGAGVPGSGGTAAFSASNIATAVNRWGVYGPKPIIVANGIPDTLYKTGTEAEKDAVSHLNTIGSAVSSSSSILTSELQNEMGAMGQIASGWQSMLQSLVTFENAATSAMKGG